jgi:hypothetical protein
MKIKKYLKFLNEDLKSDLESKLKPENKDFKSEIIEKIIKSLKSVEKKSFDDFVDDFLKDDEKNKIQGLINDADVYEFYLSYRNEIDELLSDINFYDESPSEMNSFSLYDYLVKGTLRAVKECVVLIKEESSETNTQGQTQVQSSEESEM